MCCTTLYFILDNLNEYPWYLLIYIYIYIPFIDSCNVFRLQRSAPEAVRQIITDQYRELVEGPGGDLKLSLRPVKRNGGFLSIATLW